MVQFIPPPDPRSLLPPLLACLPTAFASPRPPPALLPLLSPILRQRVQLLSPTDTTPPPSSTTTDSWLPLLCWDPHRASRLASIVERIHLEPHPVSGEIELRDVDSILYRRLDEETLHSRIDVRDVGLSAVYVWCAADELNAENGWRLAELVGMEDVEAGPRWLESMAEADEHARTGRTWADPSSRASNGTRTSIPPSTYSHDTHHPTTNDDADDDDGEDDYWAAYDRTPGRTPARTPAAKRSPAPRQTASSAAAAAITRDRSSSELEYFARYGAEVQPALDAHDPSEAQPEPGTSTLTGSQAPPPYYAAATPSANGLPDAINTDFHTINTTDSNSHPNDTTNTSPITLSHPRPSSSGSSGRASVARLEQSAAQRTRAEMGVRQHISTDVKSLFRLARAAGIERDEFEELVRTELEMLCLADMEMGE